MIGTSLDDEAGFVCLNLAIVVTSESNIHELPFVATSVEDKLVWCRAGPWIVKAAADSCNGTQNDLLCGSLGDYVDFV